VLFRSPIVPGTQGIIDSDEEAARVAEIIGYPILIKASAGGGGKGMRLAHSRADLFSALQMARVEAEKAFGNASVYLEKYVEEPRHIEIQILADEHGNIVYLGERECSIQRRNQKLIEESPSVALSPALRRQMGEVALRAAAAVNYTNAGTIEFLLDKNGKFYFMEMNTRIQVEHPVTELVTGIDLVKYQIRIAAGEPLDFTQEDVKINGWALECRINAEDPAKGFRPAPGTVAGYLPPGGFGVRVDSAAYSGCAISPFYDSMIGKVITWGRDREEAIDRMKRALTEFVVNGPPTTIPFHLQVLDNAYFRKGDINTHFIQDRMEIEC
jgi:acetyl-CoA carboxylase biotin carboxylase subunit